MIRCQWPKLVVMCLISLLVCPLGMAASPDPPDPWAKVPSMPTTCYLEPENFPEQLNAALESITADRDRQKQINDELSQKVKELDPMELANRMQEYMMENPEEAMKLMQQNAALGETTADVSARIVETSQQLQTELSQLEARYKAALEQTLSPFKPKFKDLDVRAQKDATGHGHYAPWAVKEFNALTAQSNRAYETACAEWWGTSGPFHGWLDRHKQSLVAQIPRREEAENVGAGMMIALVGTPTKSFKPTATMDVAIDHVKKAIEVFGKRKLRPDRPMEE